eukprot:10834729-Ditylum_brightwellii.AAC.2
MAATTYSTRLAAQKAATLEKLPKQAATKQENESLPEDFRYNNIKQLETNGQSDQPGWHCVGYSEQSDANQHDFPVHWALLCLLPLREAEEVDSPLPHQGSSLGSRCTGLSQQDSQDNHPQPSEDLCARQARRPGTDQQGLDLNQGNASDHPDWESPEPGD